MNEDLIKVAYGIGCMQRLTQHNIDPSDFVKAAAASEDQHAKTAADAMLAFVHFAQTAPQDVEKVASVVLEKTALEDSNVSPQIQSGALLGGGLGGGAGLVGGGLLGAGLGSAMAEDQGGFWGPSDTEKLLYTLGGGGLGALLGGGLGGGLGALGGAGVGAAEGVTRDMLERGGMERGGNIGDSALASSLMGGLAGGAGGALAGSPGGPLGALLGGGYGAVAGGMGGGLSGAARGAVRDYRER